MPQVRWGALRVEGDLKRRLEEYQRSPGTRSAMARLANDESRKVVLICEEIAKEDLHQREDPSRRSPLSLQHGKRLHESFEIVPARESDYKLIAKVRNTHPAFPYVEKGTERHDIWASGHALKFPFNGGSRGGPGKIGQFAVDWADGETVLRAQVDHPGAKPRNILGRAMRRYRRRAQKHRIS
jgi:hypothetical protein